jgi:hypothetical protein
MRRANLLLSFLLVLAVFLPGCVGSTRTVLRDDTLVRSAVTPPFCASISAVDDRSLSPRAGYKAFLLTIENKTGEFLEIIWSETFFIDPRGENGRFMFDDEANFRNNPLQPDVVFPHDNSIITLWPENLAHFYGGPFSRWAHNNMDAGENGILLTVRLKEKIFTDKILLTISYPQEPTQK